uniref:ATP synthase F0 subunit 8 n=1 Tax=Seira pallidipes TaxID=3053390 RepID=A0AAU6QCM5_9HEXA
MPQMSPLLWAFLFILFSFMLFSSFMKNYFSMQNKPVLNQEKNNFKKQTFFIKWMW